MPKIDAQYSYNFIDLLRVPAGFRRVSSGWIQAVAHVEMNEFAAKTLGNGSAYYYLKGNDNLAYIKNMCPGKSHAMIL